MTWEKERKKESVDSEKEKIRGEKTCRESGFKILPNTCRHLNIRRKNSNWKLIQSLCQTLIFSHGNIRPGCNDSVWLFEP